MLTQPTTPTTATTEVSDHRPVQQQRTCVLHIHYLVVSERYQRLNQGSQMLEFLTTLVRSQHPGYRIEVEVDIKNTIKATKFWMERQEFRASGSLEGNTIPAWQVYQPVHILRHLGIIKDTPSDSESEPDKLDFMQWL
jgi:ribosomal protein S18 acetylase RimI-like enzyme